MKKSRKNNEKGPKQISKEDIIALINAGRSRAFNIKELARKMGLRDNASRNELAALLHRLFKEGKIEQLKNGSYKSLSKETNFITGKVDHVNPKFAYVVTDEMEEDVWVSQKDMKFAIDGDKVKVAVHTSALHGRKPEGEIMEIIERSKKEFVGKVELSTRFAFVVPDNRKMYYDIFVPLEDLNHAKNGEKVIVEITEWPGKDKNPVGIVKEVLGMAGENDVEMNSIMAEFGLPTSFPEKVEKLANKIEAGITQEEISKRRDFREITTFTIDPVDAKDFDDALSIRKLTNTEGGENVWEIGVHIADVTHYVLPSTLVEKEAAQRATSVYLVDRVIPMLPEKLSNELCSLRPNEDKLTFSAVFEMTEKGKILNEWFGKTIIHSARRFHYDEAQEIIDAGQGDYAAELKTLNDIALKLRKERFRKGAIGFETIEVRFKLDEKGKPLGIIPKVRKDAHKLIEEFMLLANKRVAEFVYGMRKGKNKNTMVYRTHDYPDQEKLNAFSVFAKKFGHTIKPEEGNISAALNKLVDDIEGKPEQNVLQSLAIRTMAKAIYTTEPDIHFGLAFKHYTHFTSPIRRYPDMMSHRLLQHYLDGGKPADKDFYEELCKHSSEMERKAADAERASIKYKQAEYMLSMDKEEFEGIVSGVTEWGVFVEIVETKCEGMVRMADMEDDFYEFDADHYRIIGRRNKKIITLGDDVRVRVKHINMEKRTIDLLFVDARSSKQENEEQGRKKKSKRKDKIEDL